MDKAQLPQARKLCEAKNCGKNTLSVVNALIHWHAPLINCEWLPSLVQKLVRGFERDLLFAFEVVITFLTNFFAEWTSEVPGPPPEVLSRIDAIFSNFDGSLRDDLGTAISVWPAYRSVFAELLYDRDWLDLMDVIICSSPQFFEFSVVAWMAVNGPQLRADFETFHLTRRAVNVANLISVAQKVGQGCSPTLRTHQQFRALSSPRYPQIEASVEAVVMRTLQSDHDRLAELQEQLLEERRQADEAEKIKERRKQTYESIQQLHRLREDQERLDAANAANALDVQMKRLKLEGKLLRQADERQFLDAWEGDWDVAVDPGTGRTLDTLDAKVPDDLIDKDGIRFQAISTLRQFDLMAREARRSSMVRATHARRELDAMVHKRAMHAEVSRLANNPVLLANASSIRTSPKKA
jgi:hypothetical protein